MIACFESIDSGVLVRVSSEWRDVQEAWDTSQCVLVDVLGCHGLDGEEAGRSASG